MSQHTHVHNPTSSHLAELREGSFPISHDDSSAALRALLVRIKNITDLVDTVDSTENSTSDCNYILEPILGRLNVVDHHKWERLRRAPMEDGQDESQAQSICKNLKEILGPIRMGQRDEIKYLAGSIALVLSDELFDELKEAAEIVNIQERPWTRVELGPYRIYMTDLLLKGDAHNGGLKGVKAIAALELSRLLFDFNKDPYSLYAVKLQFLHEQIIDLHATHVSSHRIIQSTLQGSHSLSDTPLPHLDLLANTLQVLGTGDRQHLVDLVNKISETLNHNIRIRGWDTLLAKRPPWSLHASLGTLIDRVVTRMCTSGQGVRKNFLTECENSFISIFQEAGFPYEAIEPGVKPNQLSSHKKTVSQAFVAVKR